jgi:putative redox protein
MQEVTIKFIEDDLFVGLSPTGRSIVIDSDRTRDSAPGPMHLLLLAVGACTGTDVAGILKKKRERVTHYEIRVSSERRDEYPKIWQHIEVKHIVRGRHISEKAVKDAIHLSESKYCSVSAMLRTATKITMTYEIIEDEA